MFRYFISAAFIFAGLPLRADGLFESRFRLEGFHFYKIISGFPGARGAAFGRIVLDEDISMYAGRNDLRISWNGTALPYFTRTVLQDPKRNVRLHPRVIFSQKDDDSSRYILELPNPPEGAHYTGLEIETAGTFQTNVRIEQGADTDSFAFTGSRDIYRYEDRKNSSISVSNRFIRLTFGMSQDFSFPSVYASYERVLEYSYPIPIEEFRSSSDPDRNATVYYYENARRRKVNKLILNFSQERFNREVEVYVLDPEKKEYRSITTAGIRRSGTADAAQVIEFPEIAAESLKLEIIDQDNAPLTLTGVEARTPVEELIFQLPESQGDLRLYYGNRYALAPNYDIRSTFTEQDEDRMLQLTLGGHTVNDHFAYSAIEPPMSSWIIRVVFLLGLLGMAYPAYRIFSRYADDMKRNTGPGTDG